MLRSSAGRLRKRKVATLESVAVPGEAERVSEDDDPIED
jgi:hypothetical protein